MKNFSINDDRCQDPTLRLTVTNFNSTYYSLQLTNLFMALYSQDYINVLKDIIKAIPFLSLLVLLLLDSVEMVCDPNFSLGQCRLLIVLNFLIASFQFNSAIIHLLRHRMPTELLYWF